MTYNECEKCKTKYKFTDFLMVGFFRPFYITCSECGLEKKLNPISCVISFVVLVVVLFTTVFLFNFIFSEMISSDSVRVFLTLFSIFVGIVLGLIVFSKIFRILALK